jgi:hypothetical protein
MNKKYININFYNGTMATRIDLPKLATAYDYALKCLIAVTSSFALAATVNMLQYFNIL